MHFDYYILIHFNHLRLVVERYTRILNMFFYPNSIPTEITAFLFLSVHKNPTIHVIEESYFKIYFISSIQSLYRKMNYNCVFISFCCFVQRIYQRIHNLSISTFFQELTNKRIIANEFVSN